MDPTVVASDQFDILWTRRLPGNYRGATEQVFAQPLVYTPGDTQYVYVATTMNNIYKIDAKTGEIVANRNLAIPFLEADLDGCTDINPLIGATVVDFCCISISSEKLMTSLVYWGH
jgi:outer membrane protein assembly factor BamB